MSNLLHLNKNAKNFVPSYPVRNVFQFAPENKPANAWSPPPGLAQNWGPIGKNVERGYFNANGRGVSPNSAPEGFKQVETQVFHGNYNAKSRRRKRTRKSSKKGRKQTRRR